MPIFWTSEQVIAQAPDDSSVKAGRSLAIISKWVSCGYDEHAVWGECKGSGQRPYQVTIELSEPAFKCSCPSRKFPCKHGLGLFLLYANDQLKENSRPAFCSEWLAKRSQTQERKKETSEAELTPEKAEKRGKAKIKRIEEREAKVAAGLRELEIWIADMIRQGLATVQSRPTEYWEKMAKRLIDAQAPNAARLVLQMSSLIYRKNKYQEKLAEKLLEHLSGIYLICESYRRINELPAAIQADIKTAIGFTVKEEELQTVETIEDVWQIHGIRVFEEEKLRVQRVWLSGENSRRSALILNFAFRNQPLDVSFAAGTKIKAELAFYPGNSPQRAFLKTRRESQNLEMADGCETFTEFLQNYSEALAKNVWLETFPAMLKNVIPVRRDSIWFLRDKEGKMLKIDADFGAIWKLFAICGNQPAAVFAEWDGETFLPLTVWTQGKSVRL